MKNEIFKSFCELESYLKKNGIKFTPEGYPVFKEEFLLRENPDEILPFEHRNSCKDKKKTVICFFADDRQLYRRLPNLEKDAEIYSQYMGICGFDLSPRVGWDVECQRFNICLSQMATIYLALQGIKIIPNFRIGDFYETVSALRSYPENSPFAVGTLGCSHRKKIDADIWYLRAKTLFVRPSNLLFYGTLKQEYRNILKEMNLPFRVYEDFRTKCFREYMEKTA